MKILSILLILALGYGCSSWEQSNFESEPTELEPPTPEENKVEAIKKPVPVSKKKKQPVIKEDKKAEPLPTVEAKPIKILWAKPSKVPLYYHLHYGFSSEEINKTIKLKVEELTTFEDRVYGSVFSYELGGVPNDKNVFIFMRSENSNGISAPSQVLKVNKQTGIGTPVSGKSDFKPEQENPELRKKVLDSLEKLKTDQ